MRIYKKTGIVVLVLSFTLFHSCKKFTDVGTPPNKLLVSEVFASDKTATAALFSIYGKLGGISYLNGMMAIVTNRMGMYTDELNFAESGVTELQFLQNGLSSGNRDCAQMWRDCYQVIYYTNAIMDGVSKSTTLTAPVKKNIEGEVRFLRAYHYFYLVNLFGAVPLALTTDYEANRLLARSPVADVYKLIIDDLTIAAEKLDEQIITGQKTRPNSWAARAFLARAHLYAGNWAAAEQTATGIIESNKYQMETDLDKVFTTTSKEAIWQLALQNLPAASWHYEFIPAGIVIPKFPVTDFLLNGFEAGDTRKTKWIGNIVVSGTNYAYPWKYKQGIGEPVTKEYMTLFRLAEVYLVRAEARARQNKLDLCTDDVNVIKLRAGLTAFPNFSSQDAALTAILQERRIELMFENAHRWFDLKRFNKTTEVLQPIKGAAWQEVPDLFFPISDINTAPNLKQNPGYD